MIYLRAKLTRILCQYFGNDDRRIEHALRVLLHADRLMHIYPGCELALLKEADRIVNREEEDL